MSDPRDNPMLIEVEAAAFEDDGEVTELDICMGHLEGLIEENEKLKADLKASNDKLEELKDLADACSDRDCDSCDAGYTAAWCNHVKDILQE